MKIYPIKGIEISSLHSGMYEKKRLDLSLVKLSINCIVSLLSRGTKLSLAVLYLTKKILKKVIQNT